MLVDVPAGTRRRGRELAVLLHDLGGPRLRPSRQIEKRPIKNLTEAEDAEAAVELPGAAALDERRGLGRRGRIRCIERQGLPKSNRQRSLSGTRGQERRLTQAVDAREPRRIERVQEVREVLLELRRRRPRDRIEQRRGPLERREPNGVASRAAGRVEPDRLQRQAVGVDDAVAFLHEQRILRCHTIQLFEREPARRFGELSRRPAALDHDPRAGRHAGRLGGKNRERFAVRVDAFEPGLAVPAIHGAREVEVVVDEAGDHGCTSDVDDPGVGTRVARDFLARAARHDAAVVDRQGLDDAEVRVDGQDLAVRDDGVDVLLRERGARERGKDADREDQALELIEQRARANLDRR